MTILEVIQKSSDFLAKKGVESPRLQIELMLAHLLSMPRMQLYLNFERPLTEEQVNTLRTYVQRRANREPLQYILGTACFCGLDFLVGPGVLIPRPETEILAEKGWSFLNSIQSAVSNPKSLDFGTGSGCLAILLAVKAPQTEVYALDVSPKALGIARKNAVKHNVRVQFNEGNGFSALPAGSKFHLIVSNPPYIATAEIETLEPEITAHEPKTALDGGVDGLDFYRRLAAEAPDYLEGNGKIMLEFGEGQAPAIKEIFEQQNWIVEAIEADYTQRLRILIATRNSHSPEPDAMQPK